MATALFHCASESVARNLEKCFPVAPEPIKGFKVENTLIWLLFDGSCSNMYWWCRDIANQSPYTVSFIGVDEEATEPIDIFKLGLLSAITSSSHRTEEQNSAYFALVEKFLDALEVVSISSTEVCNICKQSVIGIDACESDSFCAKAIRDCILYGRDRDNHKALSLDDFHFWSGPNNNTLIRVMAHICYLGLTLRQNEGRNNPAVRLFSLIFGR